MQAMQTTPRVWIACLASYNAGRLIGEWVDAADVDEMEAAKERVAVQAVKAAKEAGEYPVYFSEPEEFAIHDYDGFPSSVVWMLGEYPDWELVAAIGAALDDDPRGVAAFLRFWDDCIGGDVDADAISGWLDYLVADGIDSEADYAMHLVDECGGWGGAQFTMRDGIASYIDWDRIADELFQHGTHYLVDGYVFDSEAR